jgi:hypothetical protein
MPLITSPGRCSSSHDHVFFLESGEPLRTLHHPQVRWRKTLQSLKLPYRGPYTAAEGEITDRSHPVLYLLESAAAVLRPGPSVQSAISLNPRPLKIIGTHLSTRASRVFACFAPAT